MPDNSQSQHLLESCRALRVLLSTPIPPALRVAAPKIAEALPHVRVVLVGLEDALVSYTRVLMDLADRVRMLEIAMRERL